MLRMTKQADYGLVLLSHLAGRPGRRMTTPELAHSTHLPTPMVSKILKALTRAGILESRRGVKGGYQLAANPHEVSLATLIEALEGPISITECSDGSDDICSLSAHCHIRENWRRIDRVVRSALDAISLAELAEPQPSDLVQIGAHRAEAS